MAVLLIIAIICLGLAALVFYPMMRDGSLLGAILFFIFMVLGAGILGASSGS